MNFSHSETATIGASTPSAFDFVCEKLLLVPAGAFVAAGGATDPLGGTVVPPPLALGAPAPPAPALAPLPAPALPLRISFTCDAWMVRQFPSGVLTRYWFPIFMTLV